jgi:uncharacterized protein involved in exopolysaccharide biosynthesis
MSDPESIADDEIDLGELFASLWAYKLLMGVLTAAAVLTGGLYALNSEKTYTSEAVFQLEDAKDSGLRLPSELSGLAALTGLGGVVAEGNILFDRIKGREFILRLDESVDLMGDPFFNTYNPDAVDPAWKAAIKWAIGYQSEDFDPDQVGEKNIVTTFRESVAVEETENGAISVKVDHTDPARAAQVANAIMDQIVSQAEFETKAEQTSQITYLSETLADTLREMEVAQARLKNFAIENSTLSIEALAVGSVALDQARNRLERAVALEDAASALLAAIDGGQANAETYTRLRQTYPIIDDVEFRRVLGLSEIISEFTWPDRELLAAVADTLKDRSERIERDRERLEDEALTYADSAEQLATLEREAKIAEASYTVLIEQVKAQSLVAGYTGERVKVFERAVPPLVPSKPNRLLVVALAAVLGIFVGSGIALVLAMNKGVFFSRRALVDELNPNSTLQATRLGRLNGTDVATVRSRLTARASRTLSEVAVALRGRDSRYAVVLGGGTRCTARAAALATAATISDSGRKVAVVDLSRIGPADAAVERRSFWADLQSNDGVSEVAFAEGRDNIALLASTKFDEAAAALAERFDFVVFSAEMSIAEMSSSGLASLKPTIVLLGRPQRTAKALIKKLRNLKLPTILLLE